MHKPPTPEEVEAAIALAVSEYAECGIKLDPDAVREALEGTDDPLGRIDDLRALKDD
jgi:hypothetical protein